ncbi:MAG: flagellar hook-basal body complex protein FliE [Bacteroidia bacterium]|jgi:flagellar hook-basal body complex protein FliE
MSSVDINQVLAQMREMSAVARNAGSEVGVEGAAKLDFGEMMKNSLEEVNEVQAKAKELATAFESGDPTVDLPELMVALQKSSISFQAITQVRNKLLSAYQEVMNMQV